MPARTDTDTLAVLIHPSDFYGRDIPGLPDTICVCIWCFFDDTMRANFALKRALSSARPPVFLERHDTRPTVAHRCHVCGRYLVFTDTS